MFGSATIDIVIGIVFVLLLLSIFATAINEIMLSAIGMRGKMLLRGIQALLNDKGAEGLVALVYTHGQVFGLFEGLFNAKKPSNLPSYIPSRNFALALLDSVEGMAQNVTAKNAPSKPYAADAPPPTASFTGAAVPAPTSTAPAVQSAAPLASAAATTVIAAVKSIIPITQALKDAAQVLAQHHETEKLGKPLLAMIHAAGDDADKLRQSVEDWYNSGMDRVSGWYKHHTQKVLLCIGIVMAVTLNADSIAIVRQLSKDPTLRQVMVAAAQTATNPSTTGTTSTPGATSTPSGTATASSDASQSASSDAFKKQLTDANTAFANIHNLGVPLGYPMGFPHTAPAFFEAVLGWVLTAIAISLGAPFWFDLLNKIMVIRSTVKPREKSMDEPSKS